MESILLKKKTLFAKYDGLKMFLLAFGLALAVFLPVMLMTGGYQLFFGDFQLQQIPFYSEVNRAIHNGEFFWNWNTDMGVNTIASYSFYLLGSPFFLITLLFPHSWTTYLIAPLYCLKIALAALGAFYLIRRRVQNKHFAMVGGILYAFSGFQMFNLVFNHFHDVVAFFPFVILAFDAAIEKGTRGWLAVMVFLSALYSYFFLPHVAVFVIIYYFVRLATKDLKFSWARLGQAVLEAVIGLLMALVILYPTLLALADFPRANEAYGKTYDMWFFSSTKRYFEIFRGILMPPEIPGDLNFFHRAGGSWVPNWTSTSAWLPLFSVTGVWAYIRTKREKRDWLSVLLLICLLCSVVPLLNSVFLLFKSNYYTRWWYMPILFMGMATAIALDRKDANWKAGIKGTAIAGGILALPIGLSGIIWVLINPSNYKKLESVGEIFEGLEQYPDRFWLYVFFFALCIAVTVLLVHIMRPIYFGEKSPLLGKDTPADEPCEGEGAASEAAEPCEGAAYPLTDTASSLTSVTPEAELSAALPEAERACTQADGEEADFASHCDGADTSANAEGRKKNKLDWLSKLSTKKRYGTVVLAVTCLFAFLSWTFYEQIGYSKGFEPDFYTRNYLHADEAIQLDGMENTRLENYDGVRNLSMFAHTPGLSSFHSVVPTSTVEFYDALGIDRGVATAVPIEYGSLRSLLSVRYVLDDDKQRNLFQERSWLKYHSELEGFDVWENTDFIPMGFCYDNAIYRSDFDTLADISKANILLAAMVIEDADAEKFLPYMDFTPFYTLSYNDLSQHKNVTARASMASKSWQFGKNSFTSVIDMTKDNYVFYSIPYDAGWTAYVDGVEAEIVRVNVGFMAVLVGEGEHTVEFKYVSPGFITGAKVSAAATGILAVYWVSACLYDKRKKRKTDKTAAEAV